MSGVRAGLAVVTAAAALAALGGGSRPAAQIRPVDRWLVAVPDAPDTVDAAVRLSTDLLAAPGEPGVLPDRGQEAGGVTWSLMRRDGVAAVPLDSVVPGAGPGTVVYAHAYLRLPADRTLRLDWEGVDCTSARAWLNGREVTARPASARFGAGWNTLLLKLVAGDCPFGYRALLAAEDDGPALVADDGRPELAGVRVQASRPYGDVRTGPEDWVVPADTVRIASERRWRGDRLYAGLLVGLTAWGRAPVAEVELELRNGSEGRATAPWLVPGTPGEAVVPVRLDRLDRLLAGGRVDVRLRWGDEEIDRRLHVAGAPPGDSERVALEGWETTRSGGRTDGRAAGRLPNAAGWVMEGEWRVPEALAGRALVLDTIGAPADYLLDGSPPRDAAGGAAGVATLCSPCERGVRLRLTATSTAAWTGLPSVRMTAAVGGA